MLYIPKLENKSPMGRITGSENNLLSSVRQRLTRYHDIFSLPRGFHLFLDFNLDWPVVVSPPLLHRIRAHLT